MARILTLLLGLGLLTFVVVETDLGEVWARLVELSFFGAAAVFVLYFAAFVLDTASWQLMLPSAGTNGTWLYRLWKVRMVGEALNNTLPVASMGGEPVKAVLLKKTTGIGYRESGASLVMAKTVNLLALVAFSGPGFVLLLRAESVPAIYRLLAGVGLAALALGVVGFFVVQRWQLASRLAHWLSRRHIGRKLEQFLVHIQDVDDHFAAFYAQQPGRFAAALGLAIANWILGMVELYVIMDFLGQPISLADAWLIETVAQLVRTGTFFIPASIGASEAALFLIYGALTGQPALGLVVSVIRRARELLWVVWGLWLGWLFSLMPKANPPAISQANSQTIAEATPGDETGSRNT